MLQTIREQQEYQQVLNDLKVGKCNYGLGLTRPARLAILAALSLDLNIPILVITDRADRAVMMFDELGFWLPEHQRFHFPEPNPMFYEQAAWGAITRRDRLTCLSELAKYHLPGSQKPDKPAIVIASLRAVMTRTMPRRDFIIASKTIRTNQSISPEDLKHSWVDLGYEHTDVVLDQGQFSQRGGILDVWGSSESFPVRLDFFGNESNQFVNLIRLHSVL
jgi:transcription-repair coupling factor (superfamily II helicase)